MIEATNRGTYIISGSDGPDIVIHEIDRTGLTIRRQVFFIHPNRNGWQEESVVQHPAGFIVSASEATSTSENRYFGMHRNNGSRIWGSMGQTAYGGFNINTDSTFWSVNALYNSGMANFSKIDRNGRVISNLLIINRTTRCAV